jgi:hypothetical protein
MNLWKVYHTGLVHFKQQMIRKHIFGRYIYYLYFSACMLILLDFQGHTIRKPTHETPGIQNSGVRIQNRPHISFQQFIDFFNQLDWLTS